MNKLKIENIKIIDAHCHPFDPLSEGSEDLRFDFNLYHLGAKLDNIVNSLTSKKIIEELRVLLELDKNISDKEIISYRNSLYKKDPKKYISILFEDANFDILLLDTGYPDVEFGVEKVEFQDFVKITPCKANQIYRIEPIIFQVFNQLPEDFQEAKSIIENNIKEAITANVIGFKSVIAYETGLEIKKKKEVDVAKAYNDFRMNKNKDSEKILRDFFVYMAVSECNENDIPMQFHTGMGSVPILDLYKANPLLLQEFLEDEVVKKTKIILTHAGYPFCEEAGMLVSSFSNLFCDVSAISTYFGASALRKSFLRLFELSPMDKIMFGTDGGIIPETYWFGAKQGIKDLESSLIRMIDLGWISLKDAHKYAEMILHKNAINIYKLYQ
jgi:hypothetical protein